MLSSMEGKLVMTSTRSVAQNGTHLKCTHPNRTLPMASRTSKRFAATTSIHVDSESAYLETAEFDAPWGRTDKRAGGRADGRTGSEDNAKVTDYQGV